MPSSFQLFTSKSVVNCQYLFHWIILHTDNFEFFSEFPSTMEQLLERQWEQGSHFLMQQGHHFDSKFC